MEKLIPGEYGPMTRDQYVSTQATTDVLLVLRNGDGAVAAAQRLIRFVERERNEVVLKLVKGTGS